MATFVPSKEINPMTVHFVRTILASADIVTED